MPSTVILVIAGVSITTGAVAAAVAIAVVASVIISKAFAVDTSYNAPSADSTNPGNRQQVAPATDNKLPVVYGSAYVGGIVTDLSITSDNQTLYYVLSLCEVTNNGADIITFGDVYFGGKKVVFDGSGPNITGLLDESTGVVSTKQAPYIQFYFYRNGSNTPTNSSLSAIQVMQSSGLTYKWDSNKKMSNCAFVIMVLKYNSSAGITGLQQTKFKVTNSRSSVGDCFYDYLTNDVYGAALPVSQIDTASLTALNTYSNQNFTYQTYEGQTATQPRFKFNGVVDVKRTIMQNLQDMSACCDCLVKYNEITAKWGVVVQTPVYDIAMDLNDSNMVSAISISPLDLSGSYNVAEVKYPNVASQDSFDSVTYDLSEIDPSLLFPNEPVNKQSISLPLVNNNVQAQYLATRFLKAAREDLQVQVDINFSGIQLEAGDIVTITSSNYGWTAKEFRINKVIENFADDGAVLARLTLSEFNSSIYDDANITQFTPAPNTGIGDPLFFGSIPKPVILSTYPYAAIPSVVLQVTTAPSGITQYVEVWYSIYENPTQAQMYFAGTSQVQSSGSPWDVSQTLPLITLNNLPSGDWYFFTRMVNSLGTSIYSPASDLLIWRQTTTQYSQRYLSIAYADSLTGTGFSFNPRNKNYYGLNNVNIPSSSVLPSDYTWYLADPTFGTDNYLYYCNRGNNLLSFSSGTANYVSGNAQFAPTNLNYDPSIWQALPDGYNIIDLNQRTGQLIQYGTTTTGTGEISVSNNPQGQVIASLAKLLDFGPGVYTYTGSASTLTIDIYGRVVGFSVPDELYYTMVAYDASAGQTVFPVTRAAGYILGQSWVFRNGLCLDEDEYVDNAGNVTLNVPALANDIITIVSFKSQTVAGSVYATFTRYPVYLTNQSSYTASGWLNSGNEFMFLNGCVVNAQDYNITGQTIAFNTTVTGYLEIVQWTDNNLGTPTGNPVNIDIYTTPNQATYRFNFDPNAFNLWYNGPLLLETIDYSVASGVYTLAETPESNLSILTQQTFSRTGAI